MSARKPLTNGVSFSMVTGGDGFFVVALVSVVVPARAGSENRPVAAMRHLRASVDWVMMVAGC